MLILPYTSMALTFTVDGINYSSNDGKTASVIRSSVTCPDNVVIPSNVIYDNIYYIVTKIDGSAFSWSSIKSIDIPNSVTSIGNSAFAYCSGLTSIKIPNSVTSIGNSAFAYCSGLTSIEIHNSVTAIGNHAFNNCTGLTSIEIPNSVTSIGDWAFSECDDLTSVYFNAENCKIEYYYTFEDFPIEKFTFGKSVKVIPDFCCNRMKHLTSIEIPNNVTSIGIQAFYGCDGLTSVYFNAENCTRISYLTFEDCPIEKITFGESVKTIPDYCCGGLTRITKIEIPNSVTSIGNEAFAYCSGLTSIEIPNSVTSIGRSAFNGCAMLTSITVDKNNAVYDSRDNCNAIIETATNTLIAGCKNTKIPNSVTAIGNNAFSQCTGLTSIEMPNSVTSIGNYAFSQCTGLTSIEMPNSVTSIGNNAFSECTGLTSIEMPNSVTSIGINAFFHCTGLTSIEIPNSVTSIGGFVFQGCTGLTSIEMPSGVTSIGQGVSAACGGLISIIVDKNNKKYDSRDNCSAIIETTTNILVAGCKNTKIPNSVTSIGDYAFISCSGLTSIEIPNSVTSIGNEAFAYCSGLTSIEIPNSVTSIGKYAFNNCTGLTSIICYAQTPPELDNYEFQLVKKSIPVYIPYGSIDDYTSARGWSEFTNFMYLPADPVDEELDEPKVTPEKTSVVIAWPMDESAETYTINITKGGVTVCSLTFDANGNVVTIDYPSNGSTKGAELRDANALPNGYSYEITGLEEGAEYSYTVTAQNGSGVTVDEYSGTFRTQGGAVSVEEYNLNRLFSLQNAVVVNDKSISVNGVEPSDVSIYNTAGKQVGNPVPASGVYVVKVGDEAVKVMVK